MSVLARVFEAAGLTTVAVALVREHAERTRPPRALWVPFYFGYAMGRPDDPAFQHKVLAAALDTLNAGAGPVLVDYPDDAGPIGLPQASEVTANGNGGGNDNGSGELPTLSAADEITALRSYYERWIEQRGRTAVGLTGVPQRRFRGIIRFLEAYAESDDADFDERPADVTVTQFVRYCADDLKAFCYEARMAQRPNDAEPDIPPLVLGRNRRGRPHRQHHPTPNSHRRRPAGRHGLRTVALNTPIPRCEAFV